MEKLVISLACTIQYSIWPTRPGMFNTVEPEVPSSREESIYRLTVHNMLHFFFPGPAFGSSAAKRGHLGYFPYLPRCHEYKKPLYQAG